MNERKFSPVGEGGSVKGLALKTGISVQSKFASFYTSGRFSLFLVTRKNFHPKGDGGSGRRPLPPDHLTF